MKKIIQISLLSSILVVSASYAEGEDPGIVFDSTSYVETNSNTNNSSTVNTTSNNTNTNTNINTNTSTVNSTSTNTNNNINTNTSTSTNNNFGHTTSENTNININQNTSTSNNTNTNINSGHTTSENVNNSTINSTSNNTNTNINSGHTTSENTNTNINQNTSTSTSTNNNVNQNINSGEMTNRNLNTNKIEQEIKQPPPTAIAPAMMSGGNQDLCTTGTSGAVQTQILGVSSGGTVRDLNCERLKNAKTLYDMGMKVAAVATLCQDRRVFDAMWNAGTPCPYDGMIGEQARVAWTENPNKIPKPEVIKGDEFYKKTGFGALLGGLLFFLF